MSTKRQSRQQKKQKKRKVDARKRAGERIAKNALIEEAGEGFTSELASKLSSSPRHIRNSVYSTILDRVEFRNAFLPTPFPATFAHISKKVPAVNVKTLHDNLLFSFAIFKHYCAEIDEFVELEITFFGHLFVGDLDQCDEVHKKIRTKFGESLWTIETGLLLGEEMEGITGNRRFLANVNESTEDHFVTYLASILTQRVESSLSVSAYEGAVQWSLREVKEDPEFAPLVAETLFRVSFHRCGTLEQHANSILNRARFYSLIDYYTTFRRIVRCCASQAIKNVSPQNVSVILKELRTQFEDCTFKSLTWIGSNELFNSVEQDLAIRVDDLYHRGKFNDVIEVCSKAIPSYPGNFCFYENLGLAAAKLKINLGDLDSPVNEASISHAILRLVHSTLSRDKDMEDSLDQLLKFAYALDSTSLGNRLIAFWLSYSGVTHILGQSAFLASVLSNINSWALFTSNSERRRSLRPSLMQAFPSNATIEYFSNDDPQPTTRMMLYEPIDVQITGTKLFNSGKIDEAIREFRRLKELVEEHEPLYRTACQNLVSAFLQSDRLSEAANEIIDMYLTDPNLIYGSPVLHLDKLIEALSEDVEFNDIENLCWPLIYWLSIEKGQTERDKYKQFVSVDQFLVAKNCKTVSEYLRSNPLPSKRLVMFLHKACTSDAIRLNSAFENTDDLENERIAILQYILLHDASLRVSVTDEISELTKKAKLREAAQKVESSRIFVNNDGIRTSLGDDHKKEYERFVRIRSIEDERLRKQFDASVLKFDTVISFQDLAFTLFCSLFDQVKKQFVSNKAHGLQTYLSMRIRHGHLSAQIRGQFENLALVTRKTGPGSDYGSNKFWREKFQYLGKTVVDEVDQELKAFSLAVDTLVDEVNFEWIRITEDENRKGMLNYEFRTKQLAVLYLRSHGINSYDEFLDSCLASLWYRTGELLNGIRVRINGELVFRLTDMVSNLETAIHNVNHRIPRTEFSQQIATCRTSIQREMTRFAEWFTTSGGPKIRSFDFDLLVELANLNVHRVSPKADFKPNVNCTVTNDVDGQFFSAFCDIMFNLFDNVVQHSNTEAFRPDLEISTSDELLVISISNQLGGDVELANIQGEVETANKIADYGIEDSKLQTEGKTGFVKIYKSLHQDLRQPSGRVECSVDEKNIFKVTISLPWRGVLIE